MAVCITEKRRNQLRELKERFKIPAAGLIRQNLHLFFRKREDSLSGQITLP